MHLPGTEVYRTLELEQHSSPTQNTNIQIYDLFFLHYLQCVVDKGKIDDFFLLIHNSLLIIYFEMCNLT